MASGILPDVEGGHLAARKKTGGFSSIAEIFAVRIGTGPWVTVVTSSKGRGIILPGLVPGTMYDVQVRAIGGSTGYSDWSDPVSHMCM